MEAEDKPKPRPIVLEPVIVAYFGDLLLHLEQMVNTLCSGEQSPDDQ